MQLRTFAAAAVSMTWLTACALPGPDTSPTSAAFEVRVLVKLVKPSIDGAVISNRVAAAAGTRARYLSATSAEWHALALVCSQPQACEDALQRLSTHTADFEVVQRDERKRIVTP